MSIHIAKITEIIEYFVVTYDLFNRFIMVSVPLFC